jgi:tryptophan-rich sensory protein
MKPLRLNYFVIPLITILEIIINGFLIAQTKNIHILKITSYIPSLQMLSVAWNIVFTLIMLAVLIVWNTFEKTIRVWTIFIFFIINAIANIAWTYFFFYKSLFGTAIFIGILAMSSLVVPIPLIWPSSRFTALILVPYLLCGIIMTIRNINIWILN